MARPATVTAQRIGYTISPTASRVVWDDSLPLDDVWMYGGRLGIRFGSHVELQPFYLRATDVRGDSSRVAGLFANAIAREFKVEHYGANLQLNLGGNDLSPFVRAGGGIIRYQPDSGDVVRRITAQAGAGVRFDLGGIDAELFVEQFGFRLSPTRLYGANGATSSERGTGLRNMSYGASFSIPLSSDADDDPALWPTRFTLEPFVGRLTYHGDLGLDRQDLFGGRVGAFVGSVVGLQGFYWRGVNDDRDKTIPVSGYGGEAQFNLNDGSGIVPYLVLGAGRIDFGRDFRDSAGNEREDRSHLVVGGGLSIRLSDRLRLNAAVRDFVMTREANITDTGSPDDLLHNRLVSAGFTFALGGGESRSAIDRDRREREARTREAREREVDERESRDRDMREDERRERELRARELREQDAVRQTRDRGMRDREMRDREMRDQDLCDRMMRGRPVRDREMCYREMHERLMRERDIDERRREMQMRDPTREVVVIPVPRTGEIIVRYGMPPMRGDSLRQGATGPDTIVRIDSLVVIDSIRRTLPPGDVQRRAELDRQERALIEARIAEQERRIEAMRRELEMLRAERLREMQRPPERTPDERMREEAQRDTTVARRGTSSGMRGETAWDRFGDIQFADLMPFFGAEFGDGTKLALATRVDLGRLDARSSFDVLPELSLAIGEGESVLMALVNFRYMPTVAGSVKPYALVGGGLSTRTFLALGTSVGARFDLAGSAARPMYGFAEVQGINFFNQTRLLFGIAVRR